jgi:preprotein translocase subunit YajC
LQEADAADSRQPFLWHRARRQQLNNEKKSDEVSRGGGLAGTTKETEER